VKNNYTIILWCSIVFLQACGGNTGPGSERFQRFMNGQEDKATSVETITVERSDISEQIRSFGNIRAQDIVQITPQVSNRITEIHADLGDTVRQDQKLAQIYQKPFRDQYEEALSQLEQSRINFQRDSSQFERQKKLFNQDLISATEFDEARATYQNSKAQMQASRASLTQSEEDLENTVIRSPVYGVVLTRNVAQGDLASTGEAAFEIANLVGYETRVYLPVEDWKKASVGQEVSFRVSNQQEVAAKGRVARKSPRIDPTTGLGEVVIALTQTGPSIFQGVLIESIINVTTHNDAIVIPRTALVENVQTFIEPESNTIQIDRTYSAFVVRGDSLAVKKDLRLGIEQGDKVEVLAGLQEGDQIVVTGKNSLSDSTKVRIAGQNPFQQRRGTPIESNPDLTDEQRQQLREERQDSISTTNPNGNE